MNTTKLVVLGLVFLSAVLIHILVIKREGFETVTKIDATNVKNLFIQSMQELIAHYNTLRDASPTIQADKRFKKQRYLLANFINDINSKYSQYEYAIDNYDYGNANALTLEELGILKQFLSYKMDDSYTSLTPVPATFGGSGGGDIGILSLRLANITSGSGVIFRDIMQIPGATSIFSWINNANVTIQQNFTTLKQGYASLSDANKPVIKSELYITFLLDAYDNFDLTKVDSLTIPTLQIENIPVSISSSNKSTSTTTTTTPTTTSTTSNILSTSYGGSNIGVGSNVGAGSNVVMGWSGDRLKSLFYSLVSYGKVSDKTKDEETKDEEIKDDEYSIYASASLGDIRDIVDEELDKKLKEIKKGPKDSANDKISDRTTSKDSTKDTSCSDSLAQGKWFRTADNESCPYAAGQKPIPYPIDMNDYIRKDSIPCWGCTLK
jgi:hypothetical protein